MDKPLSKRSSAINCHCFLCISAAMLLFCTMHLCIANEAAGNNEQPQNEPVVCILRVPEAKSGNARTEEYKNILKLANFKVSNKNFKISEGISERENEIFKPFSFNIYLYKREEDPDNKGALLLKFEIGCNGKLYPLPEISWNQKDDVLLWSGGNCIVFLSTSDKFTFTKNVEIKNYHFKF